jgi:phage terminase large subunit
LQTTEELPISDDLVAELAAIEAEVSKRERVYRVRESIPAVFGPFFQPARNKGAWGGRGSAKSESFARMLIYRCLKRKGTRWLCVREVQRSLAQSVKQLLDDVINYYQLTDQFKVMNNHIRTPGNGVILFVGMQDHTADSIKSLQGFDGAWIEEAQAISLRSLEMLRPTLRKEESEIWFTWNPRSPKDPVDALLRSPDGPPPRSIVLKVNHQDNPYFPNVLREEMEWDRKRDHEKYLHIWEGQYERHSEARVFRNWIEDAFETPEDAQFLFGGDWGFSVDPTTLIRGYIIGRNLFIDQERYMVGCEIDDTPALFDSLACTKDHLHAHQLIKMEGHVIGSIPDDHCDGMARDWEIVTDSARPETISYMQRHGYPRIIGAKKGPDSIKEGVQFLKNYNIVVHPRCRHTIDELVNYSYKRHNLTGEVIPVLEDKKNHIIDPCRYMVEKVRNPTEEFLTW